MVSAAVLNRDFFINGHDFQRSVISDRRQVHRQRS